MSEREGEKQRHFVFHVLCAQTRTRLRVYIYVWRPELLTFDHSFFLHAIHLITDTKWK